MLRGRLRSQKRNAGWARRTTDKNSRLGCSYNFRQMHRPQNGLIQMDDQSEFLTFKLIRFFELLRCISPMRWLACISPRYKNPNAGATEIYVLICLLFELSIGLVLFIAPHISQLVPARFLFCFIAFLRVIEIIQRSVVTKVKRVARTLALAIINYVELALCFGIIYGFNSGSLNDSAHPHQPTQPIIGFYFSIITQLTIGYGDVSPTGWLRAVAAIQGLVGAFFIILIFARIVTSLPITAGSNGEER